MPNHVTNKVTVRGPNEALRVFVDTCFDENSSLDFNKIIPMPEILRDSQAGTHAEFGAKLLLLASETSLYPISDADFYPVWIKRWQEQHNIPVTATKDNFAKVVLEKEPEYYKAGMYRLRCLAETGYADWYSWALKHWETKWNAYSCDPVMVEGDEEEITFRFDTAWSPPEPIFYALAEMFPSLTFEVTSFDEGWGFAATGFFGQNLQYGQEHYMTSDATPELYEEVYGEPPEMEEDWEDDEAEESQATPA